MISFFLRHDNISQVCFFDSAFSSINEKILMLFVLNFGKYESVCGFAWSHVDIFWKLCEFPLRVLQWTFVPTRDVLEVNIWSIHIATWWLFHLNFLLKFKRNFLQFSRKIWYISAVPLYHRVFTIHAMTWQHANFIKLSFSRIHLIHSVPKGICRCCKA